MPKVACGGCGAVYTLPDAAVGRRARCKKCGQVFRVGARPAADPDVIPFADDDPAAPFAGQAVQRTAAAPAAAITHEPIPRSGSPDRVVAADQPASGGLSGLAHDIGRSFLFPTRIPNLVTFLLLCIMLCLSIPLTALWCIGAALVVIIYGWYMAYQLSVVEGATAGEEDLPDFQIGNFWESVVLPLLKIVLVSVISMLPFAMALAYAVVMQSLGAAGGLTLFFSAVGANPETLALLDELADVAMAAILLAALAFGLLLQPIMLLIVAVGGIRSLWRVDYMVTSIARTPLAYGLVCVVFFGLTAGPPIVVGLFEDSVPAQGAIGLTVALLVIGAYLRIVAMRAVGLYYHHLKDRFAWSWG